MSRPPPPVLELAGLVPIIRQSPGFSEVLQALEAGRPALIDGAWGSACALTCAALLADLNPSAAAVTRTTSPPAGTRKTTGKPGGTRPKSPPGEAATSSTAGPAAASLEPVLLVVLPRISDVDDFAGDLAGFARRIPLIFPAWESLPRDEQADDPVFAGRMRMLRELSRAPSATAPFTEPAAPAEESGLRSMLRRKKPGGEQRAPATPEGASLRGGVSPSRVVVTSIAALLHPVPTRTELEQSTRTIRLGDTLDPDEFTRWLVSRGFQRVQALELPGEFSLHGGIVDVFPFAETDPVRIEFFGDDVESLRRFDVETQRKIEELREFSMLVVGRKVAGGVNREVLERSLFSTEPDDAAREPAPDDVPPAEESSVDPEAASALAVSLLAGEAHLADWIPAGSWVVLVDLVELTNEGRSFLSRLDNPRGFYSVESTLARLQQRAFVTVSGISELGYQTACHLHVESVERFQSPVAKAVEELERLLQPGERVLIACHNAGEKQRLDELFGPSTLVREKRLTLCEGQLVRGFRLVSEQLVVLSDHELFHRREVRRVTTRQKASTAARAIDSFLELKEGDLVVHLMKGIARYRGMQMLAKGDQHEEHLLLEFRDQAKVYVPVSLIHLVQKYVGGAQAAPQLSALTGNSWEKKKLAAAAAVADLAGDMLTLQAARDSKPGIAYPPDSHWQQEFEEAFPYEETPDQLSAIEALKVDMQRSRPMDRLICGDVGYGKTEVAMRAAFKAIDSGRQVAVLVPTTVLAEQHFRTFTERMAEFPFRIEVLSRFRSKGEAREVLAQLAEGTVDLVIGTHRIVQPDVKFSDLGLLIIDEEQRFGVEAKDMLKKLRLEVDVLTLSATPIPRTLHLSLLGVRDISNLQTPPQDRVAVETRVCRFDGELIRRAIVRELNRGGQVYFVHNRIYNIESIADRLRSIVPEAKVGIVHGQMGEEQLEESMVGFVNGRLDVLVATTIIESGLDIPNANTIFIHQADKYGLADLHQLRGRVGRYKHRAYCYLLLEAGQSLTGSAARRLKAIEEFSELGAGFKIAMRDLEIRGAGNILGTEQSGHIHAVGYELYCQLLETAVRKLRNEPVRETAHVAVDLPVAAYLPSEYIPAGRHKIEVYRRFSRITSAEELEELVTELGDRYGALPEPVENLVEIRRIQLLCQPWQIDDLHLEPGYLVLGYRNPLRMKQLVRASGNRLRVVDQRSAYLPLSDAVASGRPLIVVIKSLLQQAVFPVGK